MKKAILIVAALAIAACAPKFDPQSVEDATPEQLSKVEPPCWWSGMTNSLQILVNGPGIGDCSVELKGLNGLKINKVHKADSPNYLFLDVAVAKGTEGTAYLVFTAPDGSSFKTAYTIGRKGSAKHFEGADGKPESFNTSDLIYLIFPDRFANGDPSNDRIEGMNDTAAREEAMSRHGGDIQGVIDNLDYIAGLGATAIWLTPVLEDDQDEESYHGYAVTDHFTVDPRFGSNELYREMVEKAHAKGIKFIMDIVPNHSGTFHWMMKDLPFGDWLNVWPEYTNMNACFSVNFDPNASKYDLAIQEGGWFVPMMPDMNLDNPFVLKYMEQWAIWWIEYAGLDGLRVDTYPYNEKNPMSEWCKAVRAEYPWINIVGECWTSEEDQLAYWQAGAANRDGFDSNLPSIMDFPLEEAILSGLCEEGDAHMWGRGLTRVYETLSHDGVYADLSNMMIFLANHDHNRIADSFGRRPEKVRMALGLLATMRGIPQLYYGDEIMLAKQNDGWNEDSKRPDFPGAEAACASPLYEYSARLFNWRKNTPVLHNGRTMHFLTRDNTYAFFRYNDTDTVFVYVNNSSKPHRVPWEHYAEIAGGLGEGTEIITGAKVNPADLTVPPQDLVIVEF